MNLKLENDRSSSDPVLYSIHDVKDIQFDPLLCQPLLVRLCAIRIRKRGQRTQYYWHFHESFYNRDSVSAYSSTWKPEDAIGSWNPAIIPMFVSQLIDMVDMDDIDPDHFLETDDDDDDYDGKESRDDEFTIPVVVFRWLAVWEHAVFRYKQEQNTDQIRTWIDTCLEDADIKKNETEEEEDDRDLFSDLDFTKLKQEYESCYAEKDDTFTFQVIQTQCDLIVTQVGVEIDSPTDIKRIKMQYAFLQQIKGEMDDKFCIRLVRGSPTVDFPEDPETNRPYNYLDVHNLPVFSVPTLYKLLFKKN